MTSQEVAEIPTPAGRGDIGFVLLGLALVALSALGRQAGPAGVLTLILLPAYYRHPCQ